MRVLLAFVALAALACLHVQADTVANPAFNFQNYFEGEWDVQKSTVNYKTNEIVHAEVLGHYSVKKENQSINLVGRYFENDTSSGEISNQMKLYVELSSPTSGQFKTGPSDDELNTLFGFEFHSQHNNIALSHGEWAGSNPAYYQFVVSSWDRFLITVHRADKPEEATLYSGKKQPEVVQKTFFQKYGTFTMIAGFFLFKAVVQMYTSKAQGRAAGGRAGPGMVAGGPGAGRGPRIEQAAVEEVTDEDDKKRK